MNTLPATLEEFNENDLAVLAGTKSNRPAMSLPTVGINYQGVDRDDYAIPKGHWRLYNGSETVYGTKLDFKLHMAAYQVREYDEINGEFTETIFFQNGQDRSPEDSAGGYRCGKVMRKELDTLSKAERKMQSDKKFQRVTWGIANLKGINAREESVKAENIPCMLRSGGKGFVPMCDYIESFKDGMTWNVITNFDVEINEHGITHWVVTPKQGKKAPITPDEYETFKGLMEWQADFNKGVLEKWRKKNGMTPSTVGNTDVVVDMSDDIPL